MTTFQDIVNAKVGETLIVGDKTFTKVESADNPPNPIWEGELNPHQDTIRRLYNILVQKDWLSEHNQIPGNRTSILTKYLPNMKDQYECWLTESILTGLATADKKIAYRCMLQAATYSAQLANRGGSFLCDAKGELQDRVESFLT